MKTDRRQGQLPPGRKITYGMPAFALAMVGIPVYARIPIWTD